jgi:hypothetical protein
MGSIESLSKPTSSEDMLRARNQLQVKAMNFFHESPEEWVANGDAAIAAKIFEEKPDLLAGYFMYQNDQSKLAEIISQFEEMIEDYRTVS